MNRSLSCRCPAGKAAVLLLAVLVFSAADAAEIRGRLRDESGMPLEGVAICLARRDIGTSRCNQVAVTNGNGRYVFRGLPGPGIYLLSVRRNAPSTTSEENTQNLVFVPRRRRIPIEEMDEVRGRVNFRGRFGFGNFRVELRLKAADFPGLEQFAVGADRVFLKVFTIAEEGAETLLYLGELGQRKAFSLRASVPATASELHYEIYSLIHPQPVVGTLEIGS